MFRLKYYLEDSKNKNLVNEHNIHIIDLSKERRKTEKYYEQIFFITMEKTNSSIKTFRSLVKKIIITNEIRHYPNEYNIISLYYKDINLTFEFDKRGLLKTISNDEFDTLVEELTKKL